MNKLSRSQARVVLWLTTALAIGCGTGTSQRVPVAAGPTPSTEAAASVPSRDVDPTTLDGKLMFGYQGWFGCPGDGSPLDTWEHWFRRGVPAAATLRVDMWPDVSELSEGERCNTPLMLPNGQPARLYSAYNSRTVDQALCVAAGVRPAGRFSPTVHRASGREVSAGISRWRGRKRQGCVRSAWTCLRHHV